MKKILMFFALVVFTSTVLFAQKDAAVEVLYFKAKLSCCQARLCDILENDVKNIVEKNFTDGKVIFKEIQLADEANKELVEKYKARSQTVIILKKSKEGEKSIDITEDVKAYRLSQNKDEFARTLIAKVAEIRSQK